MLTSFAGLSLARALFAHAMAGHEMTDRRATILPLAYTYLHAQVEEGLRLPGDERTQVRD